MSLLVVYLSFLTHIFFPVSSYVALSCLLWLTHNTTLQLFLLQLYLLTGWKRRSRAWYAQNWSKQNVVIYTAINKAEYWPATPSVLLGLILSHFFSEGEILEVCYVPSYSGKPSAASIRAEWDCRKTAKRNLKEKLRKKKKAAQDTCYAIQCLLMNFTFKVFLLNSLV